MPVQMYLLAKTNGITFKRMSKGNGEEKKKKKTRINADLVSEINLNDLYL